MGISRTRVGSREMANYFSVDVNWVRDASELD